MQDYMDKEIYTAIDTMFKPLKEYMQGVNDRISETILILEKLQIKLSGGK